LHGITTGHARAGKIKKDAIGVLPPITRYFFADVAFLPQINSA
jgi:hypothetical protein